MSLKKEFKIFFGSTEMMLSLCKHLNSFKRELINDSITIKYHISFKIFIILNILNLFFYCFQLLFFFLSQYSFIVPFHLMIFKN
jgi:hypothetical protein